MDFFFNLTIFIENINLIKINIIYGKVYKVIFLRIVSL